MATRYQIPGVTIRELDQSDYVVPLSATTLALVGVAQRGPLHVPTLITTPEEFLRTFGAPPAISDSVNEKQFIRVALGSQASFTLSFGGQTTGSLTESSDAAAIQTALNGLSSIGASGVSVVGADGQFTVTFNRTTGTAPTAGKPQPLIAVATATPANSVTITRIVAGRSRPGDYAAHAALAFLRAGRFVYFTRTCATGGSPAQWLARLASTPSSGAGSIDFNGGTANGVMVASATSPGEWANGAQVRFTKVEGNRNRRIRLVVTQTGTANITGSIVLTHGVATFSPTFVGLTAAALKDGLENIGVGEFIVTGATATATGCDFEIEYAGAYANSDSVAAITVTTPPTNGTASVTVLQTGRSFDTNVYRLDVLAPVDLSGRLDVVETYPRVMLVNDATLLSTYNAYYLADIVNSGVVNVQGASQYVRFDPSTMPSVPSDVTVDISSPSGTYTLSGGFSAMDTLGSGYAAAYAGSDMEAPQATAGLSSGPRGLRALASTQAYRFNLVAVPGVSDASVLAALTRLVEERGDSIALIDPPPSLTYSGVIDWHNQAGAFETTGYKPDSSYTAVYWPWVLDYDPYNRANVKLPPSCAVAGVFAYTDAADSAWAAPAGLQNGQLRVVALETPTPPPSALETLMTNGNVINPIVSNPREGITVWGQRTTQRRPTALDRLNVRRMVLAARAAMLPALRSLVFRPNDAYTRATFVNLVTPVLEDIKRRRGVFDFKVICDESTNPPEQIDQNILRGVLLVKPTKTAEQIIVDFTLLSTGAEFSIRQ